MPVRLWKTGVTDQSIICLPLQNNEMIPIELVQKIKELKLSRRNATPVEFWNVRHGMARTRPSNIKDIKHI
jgi:hypothetical protein